MGRKSLVLFKRGVIDVGDLWLRAVEMSLWQGWRWNRTAGNLEDAMRRMIDGMEGIVSSRFWRAEFVFPFLHVFFYSYYFYTLPAAVLERILL